MTEHREEKDDDATAEPTDDDVESNLPGTPDENAEGLVDGVAEGE